MNFVRFVHLIIFLILSAAVAGCSSDGGSGSSGPVALSCEGAGCESADRSDPDGNAEPEPQPEPEPGLGCGGALDATCPEGTFCIAANRAECDPNAGDPNCPGECVPRDEPAPECESAADCRLPGDSCVECPNGLEACPEAACDGGRCVFAVPLCAEPEPECTSAEDCRLPADRCIECPDGLEACPTASCEQGVCAFARPVCESPDPLACGGLTGLPCPDGMICADNPTDECPAGIAADCLGVCVPDEANQCRDDGECPQLRAPCTVCPDGSSSCPRSFCDAAGRCQIDIRPCPDPGICGGIAGFSCPPGHVCVDDDGDDCDPQHGGADCGGICLPEVHDGRCGGDGTSTCLPHEECVDDPDDDCDPEDDGAACPGFCQPDVEPICKTASDCPQIRIACSVCPDGNEVCPETNCIDGACEISMPACPSPPSCRDDSECEPGHVCADDPADRCVASVDPTCARICLPEGEDVPRCGGLLGELCPSGYRCVDDPSDDCEPLEGADCAGVCTPEQPRECRSAADCARILAPCVPCPDGTFACPQAICEDGRCGAAMEACAEPGFCGGFAGFPCPPDHECIDDPADDCDPANGGADCGGVCVPREQAPPECESDAECAQPLGPCLECADGTFSCPVAFCGDGQCQVDFELCADPE